MGNSFPISITNFHLKYLKRFWHAVLSSTPHYCPLHSDAEWPKSILYYYIHCVTIFGYFCVFSVYFMYFPCISRVFQCMKTIKTIYVSQLFILCLFRYTISIFLCTPLNDHISAGNGRRKLGFGSIDAEFNVDVKNGLISIPFLSRS